MSDRKEFRDLLPPERASEITAETFGQHITAGTEHVTLEDARGRILAERIDAE